MPAMLPQGQPQASVNLDMHAVLSLFAIAQNLNGGFCNTIQLNDMGNPELQFIGENAVRPCGTADYSRFALVMHL